MKEYILDEDQLGQWVDAWLTALRAQDLSDRRVRELARLLGQAMSDSRPRNATESRVLQRFEAWRQTTRAEKPLA